MNVVTLDSLDAAKVFERLAGDWLDMTNARAASSIQSIGCGCRRKTGPATVPNQFARHVARATDWLSLHKEQIDKFAVLIDWHGQFIRMLWSYVVWPVDDKTVEARLSVPD